MVDWSSPQVAEECGAVADKINMYTLGLYSWYFLSTLRQVEISLLTRKLTWRWAYVYYLGGRHLALGYLIANIIPQSYLTNQAAFIASAVIGCLINLCASGNLLLRTIAIWRSHRGIIFTLILLGWGHLATLLSATIPVYVKTRRNFAVPGAGPPKDISRSALPFLLYTFIFDFIILILTIVGLLRNKAAQYSSLWHRLYQQGIGYFVVTSVVSIPLLVLMALAVSPCLAGLLTSPSLVITIIVSSSLVTSLMDLNCSSQQSSMAPGIENSASHQFSTIQLSMSVMRPEETVERSMSFKDSTSVPMTGSHV